MYDLFYFVEIKDDTSIFIENYSFDKHEVMEDDKFEELNKSLEGVKQNLNDKTIQDFFKQIREFNIIILFIKRYSLINRGLLIKKEINVVSNGNASFIINTDGKLIVQGDIKNFINNSPITFTINPIAKAPPKTSFGGLKKTIKRRKRYV